MDEEQRENRNSDPGGSPGKETKEWTQRFLKEFKTMLQKQSNPTEEKRATVSSSAITLDEKTKANTELLEEKDKQKPLFNNYEDIIQNTLESLDGFMIILNIDGIIVFVASRVFLLLGHLSEEIVGRTLLTLLPDSEKIRVHGKLALKAPFSSTEPLGLFTQLFSRQPLDTPLHLPDQDRFYLVGLVCVINRDKLEDLCIGRKEDLEDSEDEDFVDYSFRRVKQSKNAPRTEAPNIDLDISPIHDPHADTTLQRYESPYSFSDYINESDSSQDTEPFSPKSSSSWTALACFQNCSFNMDDEVESGPTAESLDEQFKYSVVELEENKAVDKSMPLIEVKKGEKTEEKQVLEDEYQVEEEYVEKAEEAEAVREKPTEEEVKLETVKKAQEVDSVEKLELVVKVEPAENVSAGQVNLEENADSTEETEIIDVKMKELVEVTKEIFKEASPVKETEEAKQVEEKLDDPKESMFTQEAAEGDTETFFSVAATGSAQALEDITELQHIDTTHSEETLEETMEPSETMQEPTPESQICISVPCNSSASQTPVELTKIRRKRKQSFSRILKTKCFRVTSVSDTILYEELEEPCITSTQQVQLLKAGVQVSPSPDATQDPADIPADGEELPSSKDEKHH